MNTEENKQKKIKEPTTSIREIILTLLYKK
jgi:hypothetical protein